MMVTTAAMAQQAVMLGALCLRVALALQQQWPTAAAAQQRRQ
jgi:hypothetical protein